VKISGTRSTRGAASSRPSDIAIAVFESAEVSAPVDARSAATRAAAASLGSAPDSSSSVGHTRVFHSACTCSHAGVPTSPNEKSASGVAPSSASLAWM
jgi:hypothetical protein